MTVAERILRCRTIEKMEQNTDYAEKLGLVDNSSFSKGNTTYYNVKKESVVEK